MYNVTVTQKRVSTVPRLSKPVLSGCPFCGEVPPIVPTAGGGWLILHRCKIIGAVKIETASHKAETIADKWNTRSDK